MCGIKDPDDEMTADGELQPSLTLLTFPFEGADDELLEMPVPVEPKLPGDGFDEYVCPFDDVIKLPGDGFDE